MGRTLKRYAALEAVVLMCLAVPALSAQDRRGLTIWNSGVTPTVQDGGPDSAVELGVKFRSDEAGTITGIRFYKSASNVGLHIGNLWSASGALLASSTFTGETASGWQEVTFAAPVAVDANTTYVASYFAPTGHYAFDTGYFSASGTSSGPLHALADGIDGGNGVFVYQSTSVFPGLSSHATNYWVDVVFISASLGPVITNLWPSSGLVGTPVTITGSNFGPSGTVAFNGRAALVSNWTATSITAAVPDAATTGTVVVNVGGTLSNGVPFTVKTCPCTIWSSNTVPAVVDAGPDSALEVGVKFRSDVPGVITGVRFYKSESNTGAHIGNLWTSMGVLLATANFTGETASGWQQVTFSSPVTISANMTYVASYFVPSGHYAFEPSSFTATSVDNSPLHALRDGMDGGNGVYVYGNSSSFPNGSYQGGNYWVDVVFTTSGNVGPLISNITPPSALAGSSVTISGTNFGSSGAVTFSGTAATSISNWTTTGITAVVPDGATTGPVVVTVGGTASNEVPFTVKTCPCTIWGSSALPSVADTGPDSSVELGVKFRSDVPGVITGVRFYKNENNTGTHYGHLWTSTGELLAQAFFSGETASGWQQSNFVTPIGITPNTTYVMSYFAPAGHFSMDDNYFATNGMDDPPLHALANGMDGGDGVFAYGPAGTFPTQIYQARNYWVDVVFVPRTGKGPVLTSMSPTVVAPGIQVTFTGSGFGTPQGQGKVYFGYGAYGTIISWSDTQIVATVPPPGSGLLPGYVSIYQNGVYSNPLPFTVMPPVLTSMSPTVVAPGIQVTFTGSGFGTPQGQGKVYFGNGAYGTIASWSDTQIAVTVPGTGLVPGNVSIYQNGVYSNPLSFTVVPPVLTSISPTVVAPGIQVTITGSGFGQGQGKVYFGYGAYGTVVNWSDTQIVATVPETGLIPGSVSIYQNGVYSNPLSFTVIPPVLTSISPTVVSPGIQVTLTGSGFGATQGDGWVGLAASYHVPVVSWSDTQIVVTVPSSSLAPGNAIVRQNGVYSNGVAYTVIPPVLTSISPTALSPGMLATLTGSGFGAAQGNGSVGLGGSYHVPVVSWSDTQIVVTVPAGTGPGGAFVSQNGVNSNYVSYTMIPPVLTSISPTALSPGMLATLTGSGFGAAQGNGSVGLGGSYHVPVVSWSDTQIVVTVPAGTGPGGAFVSQNGVNSNYVSYTMAPSSISGMSPTQGGVGTAVTITGSNLGTSGTVTFNGTPSTPWRWSSNLIVVPVPSNATSGSVLVTVGSVQLPSVGSFNVRSSIPSTAIQFSYDAMGRVVEKTICTPMDCGTGQTPRALSTTYDLIGDLTSVSYLGTRIDYSPLDSPIDAAGRVTKVTSNLVDSQHPGVLATVDPSNGYWPHGALRKMTLANGLVESTIYNNRLQPCRINVSASGGLFSNCADALPAGNFQDYSLTFNTGGGNNGNLLGFAATGQQNFNRSYGYDSLNRIQSMSAPGDQCHGLSWTIDPWGNRLFQTPMGGICLPESSLPVDGQNHILFGYYQYDAAGNMRYDGHHGYIYDAENRVVQVCQALSTDGSCQGNIASYVYDAFGQRVEKTVGASDSQYIYDNAGQINTVFHNGAFERMYVYLNGKQLAEYFNNTVYFPLTDNLGSTRLVTGLDQSVQENNDYYPYGELIPGTGGTADVLKFAGKERDQESGLDYFGARYHASTMGRFMTPDPLLNSGRPWAPQTWNRYAYSQNSPLRLIDPSGLYDYDANCKKGSAGDACRQDQKRFDDAVTKANQLLKTLPKDSKQYAELKKSLDALGTRGDKNGVMVGFGKTVTGGQMETDYATKHITVDWKSQDAAIGRMQAAGYKTLSDIEDASGVSHEGIHLTRGVPIWAANKWDIEEGMEREAYGVESTVDEAGHSGTLLWNESWASSADKEVLRQNAVKDLAHGSMEAARCAYYNNCGGGK